MTTSHRLRTSAGAAALTAALVLVPAAAFADDAPASSTSASPSAADAAASTAAPSDAPATPASLATPADGGAGTAAPTTAPTTGPGTATSNTAVGQRPAPTAPASAPTAAAQPAAAPDASAPTTLGAGTVVVVAPEVEPSVEVYPGAAHPGSTFSVWVEGFTPGDAVSARVDGDSVSTDDVFTVYPSQLPFVFDTSGATWFDVEVPADLPLGTLTVTVSDAHGATSSTEVAVTDPIPAPVVVGPVGATAGIVTVSGSGGLPGQAAVVVVGEPDDVEVGFGFAFGTGQSSSDAAADAPADTTADTNVEEAAADLTSLVTTAEQAEAAPGEDFFDREPVEYDAAEGPASALVPIAADGTFSARFVLPAGDFGTTAVVIDTETSDTSLPAAVAPFTVSAAAAAAPAVTPAGPAGVPVNTVVGTRGGSLAYTGTESALPAGIAALALLLGGVLATTARLRRRCA